MANSNSAGINKGSKPKPLKKRLLVLCGHEPTLDPRIDWAARAAAKAGYDVRVRGFIFGDVKPKFGDPPEYISSRGRASDIARVPGRFVKAILNWSVFDIWTTGTLTLLSVFSVITWVLWRLLLAPWVILDWLMEKLGLAKYTTYPIEDFFYDIAQFVKDFANKKSQFFMRRLREGLIGYKWYFNELILKQAYDAVSYFESVDWAPDIIHANDPDSLLAASMLKKRFGSRLVYDAHEYGPEAYLMEPTPKSLFFYYEKRIMKNVDAALTVTPQISEKFNNRYSKRLKFEVVPNATPTPSELTPLDDPFLRLSAGPRLRVLFQGGFAENRGVEELIDAWRFVDHTKAVLHIRGPENQYRERLVSRAEQTGELGKSIFFLPSVPESDLISSAYSADIGVISYLSKVENHSGACPNKLSQYMQAGLMIVSVALPFVKSVIDASGAGITFDDNEPGAFAKALNTAINDEALRNQCRKNGQAYARNVFNYETYYPIITALYENKEVPTSIAHTKLGQIEAIGEKSTNVTIPETDKLLFETQRHEFDKSLQINLDIGVFSLSDLIGLQRNYNALAVAKPTWIKEALILGSNQDADSLKRIEELNTQFTEAKNDREFVILFREYEALAKTGSSHASFMLGIMHQQGLGTSIDFKAAADNYELAAEANYAPAIKNLAILYQVGGNGLNPDLIKAMYYYRKAIEFGDTEAAVNASSIVLDNELFANHRIEALKWLSMAVDAQQPSAIPLMDRLIQDLGLDSYINAKLANFVAAG